MTGSLEKKPLSHVDAAWLRMDTPVNPMVITSAVTLGGQVPFEDVRRLVEERFLRHERFQLRVVDPKLPFVSPHWERDPHFDVRSHVHHVRLPQPASQVEMDAFVSDLMSARLDPARPLWQVYVVDDAPSGTAIVSRLHHCLADGISLMRVLVGLFDELGADTAQVGLPPKPTELNLKAMSARAASYAATLGRLLLLPSDPATPLRGTLGTRKRAIRADPLPFGRLRAAAKARGGTVNDVLAAIVTGAIHTHFEACGIATRGLSVRALVPVFLRDREESGLGNHFGLVFLDLPIGLTEREARFRAAKYSMDKIKADDDASVAFAVLDALGVASNELEHIWLEVFTRKASLLTSNVPGPSALRHMCGHPIDDITVWAPVSGYMGVGVTAVSYADTLRVSLHADAGLGLDVDALGRAFSAEAAHFL